LKNVIAKEFLFSVNIVVQMFALVCDNHQNLARCFCGWSESGGDGRQELIEMGETIEPEDY